MGPQRARLGLGCGRMRLRLSTLPVALLAACAGQRPVPSPAVVSAELGIFRAAELARVRCLVVAPFENASNAPLAAEAATAALLSGVARRGTRVFPVKELRALFRDTPVELPEGIPPGLAMELAQLVGADAAIYGTVEGWRAAGDRGSWSPSGSRSRRAVSCSTPRPSR